MLDEDEVEAQVTGLLLLLMLAQLGICFYLVPYQSASLAMYARYLIQTGESGGVDEYGDSTREYKPEIDRYLEAQASRAPAEEPPAPRPGVWWAPVAGEAPRRNGGGRRVRILGREFVPPRYEGEPYGTNATIENRARGGDA